MNEDRRPLRAFATCLVERGAGHAPSFEFGIDVSLFSCAKLPAQLRRFLGESSRALLVPCSAFPAPEALVLGAISTP